MQAQPLSSAGAPDAFHGWTVFSFSVIALGALVVLMGIVYGTRLARARRRAREAAKERIVAGRERPLARSAPEAREIAAPASSPNAGAVEGTVSDSAPEPNAVPAPDTQPFAVVEPQPDPINRDHPIPTPPAPHHPPAPAAPDEKLPLTTIKGLGPKAAAILGDLGITQIDQIAALSPTDADALDMKLGNFAGRMERDRWIEQAKLLIRGDTKAYEAEFGKLG